MIKKLIISIAFLSLATFSHAETRTIKVFGQAAINTAGVDNFLMPEGRTASTTEITASRPLTATVTISNLRVLLSAAPDNGAGTQTVTIALRLNATSQAVTCTVSEAETTCQDFTNEVTGTAGQLFAWLQTSTNTPTASNIEISYQMTHSNPNYSWNIVGTSGTLSATSTVYFPIGNNGSSTSEAAWEVPMPTSGTIRNLYCSVSADPANGAGVQSWTLTMRKGAAGQSVTCTISEGATTCNDTSNSFTFVAGDVLTLQVVPANTPTVSVGMSCGVTFQNDTEGEFLLSTGVDSNMSATSTQYRGFNHSASWNTTETSVDQVANAFTLKGMYVELSGAPANGAGTQTYTFTLHDDTVSTGHSCAISEAATTCNDVDAGVTVAGASQMTVEQVPSGTPTARIAQVGILGYNKPRRIISISKEEAHDIYKQHLCKVKNQQTDSICWECDCMDGIDRDIFLHWDISWEQSKAERFRAYSLAMPETTRKRITG